VVAENPAPSRKKIERPMRSFQLSAGSASSRRKAIPANTDRVRNCRAR
jgi:hypothetical protein